MWRAETESPLFCSAERVFMGSFRSLEYDTPWSLFSLDMHLV